MKVVIIIPTYNEKGNIERVVDILEKEIFPQIKNHDMHDMHILVVDDSSPDGTSEHVLAMMKKYKNLHLLKNGEKQGLGAAYVSGMSHAIEKLQAEVMFEMDADLSHDPKKVPEFLKKIDEGYDMVIGTRYSKGGSIPKNWGIVRKIYSVFGNLLVRSILMRLSIHDWTGGFRALKKEVFIKEKSELTAFKGYTFQVSFLHKAVRDGFRVAEVPINFTDRTLGHSKIVPKEYIIDLLKYVIIARYFELKRFIKFLIVGTTGFVVQIVAQEVSIRVGVAYSIGFVLAPLAFSVTSNDNIAAVRDAVAGGIGAEGAILSNFLFNNFWTFQDTLHIKQKTGFFARLAKFNFTSFASIIIQATSIWIFVQLLGETLVIFSYTIPTRIVVVIPTIILLIIPINYIIYNKIIWKTQYIKHGKTSSI